MSQLAEMQHTLEALKETLGRLRNIHNALMSDLAQTIRTLKDLPGTVPEAAELIERAAAAAPTGPVPMADPDAYLLAAQWKTVGWRCACGATPDVSSPDWRWNGAGWEHHHGGQAGHFRAKYTPPPAPAGVVYEVTDVTDDETYFSMGIFLSLEDAKAAIAHADPTDIKATSHEPDLEDMAEYEIRERQIGMTGIGRKVYRRRYDFEYDETTDCETWTFTEYTYP